MAAITSPLGHFVRSTPSRSCLKCNGVAAKTQRGFVQGRECRRSWQAARITLKASRVGVARTHALQQTACADCNDYSTTSPASRAPAISRNEFYERFEGLPDQSALTPANFTTLADFSVSSARSLPKSADEPGRAVAPNSANRAFILGSARAALISLLSLSTISAGVLFDAPTPVQKLDSYPGTNSATVGMSGNTGERVAVVTASARSLPPLTYSIDEDMVANMTCTCPPSRSTSAGPAPRYGTCTRLTPVIILNSSPVTWATEPLPAEAKLIWPG